MTSPPCSDHGFQLLLLGSFDALWGDKPIAGLSYLKMRALLAYLAVERAQDHKREVLAELLWGGNDATTARGNLRRTLANLRQALEEPSGVAMFSANRATLRFIADGYVDVLDFVAEVPHLPETPLAAQHEERIVALYRGKFLADMSLPDCPGFQDWLQFRREALHRRALGLLEKLSNRHEQRSDFRKALRFALRHAELEPCDGNVQRRVMRLYALSGQSAAALSHYEVCSNHLKNQLGALPEEETQQLAEQIRGGALLSGWLDGARVNGQQIRDPSPAQRRQVTVLCCELGLVGVEDPDELMDALSAPQARVVDIIRQFSGHVVPTHGGGLLAYFGFPQAREDAACQAVQAALVMTGEAAPGVEVRVGIHTGLVVTSDTSSMPDTSGQTTKVAMGLSPCAAANAVVISEDTHSIVAGYFECTSLGESPAQRGQWFQALGKSGAYNRLEAAEQLTPLVGRQGELDQLLALWQQSTQGKRHVVLVQGDAGMGKSRLLLAVKDRLAGQAYALRELRCFPEFSQSPFHPLLAMLEVVFGFANGDTPQIKFDKLKTQMAKLYPASAQRMAVLFAQLFALPLEVPFAASALTLQKQKEQALAVFVALLNGLAARQPTLLLVDDLHWMDPSTLELLTLVVKQTDRSPILILLTARPEFIMPWSPVHTTTLPLHPLSKDEVTGMISAISTQLAPGTIQSIVDRADGVPLFVEEMAKIARLDQQVRIPATLQDLLAARMDMLGRAKYTAQLAAMLGREFDLGLLHKICPFASNELAMHLDTLREADVIVRVNDIMGQFKHALIQEAAYQSQSKPDRQAAHRRIAQVLQTDFVELVAHQPEVLAQHLAAAGEAWPAIEYWSLAGQRAAQRSSNLEAIAHFNAALKQLETLPENLGRNEAEFKILVSLCPVLYSTKGYGSREASQANARISILCDQVGDSQELFQAKWALVINTLTVVGSHKREVLASARQLLGMAHDDPLRQQAAHYVVANAAYWLGEFETTCTHAKQALALYRPDQGLELLARFNQDQSGPSAYLSWALYLLGFPHQALEVCEHMLRQARELSDRPQTLASALSFALALYRWMGKAEETLALSVETVALARQHDLSVWLTVGEMSHGWAQVMHGRQEGIAELQSSISRMRLAMGGISVAFVVPLVDAYVHLHQYNEALDLLTQVQADAQQSGDGHFTAELHRLKGVCLLGISKRHTEQAESCFEQALVVSRQQRAKCLELRAAMSMAQLWRSQGKSAQARDLLYPVHSWFTEGIDTHDLRAASQLLQILE